MRTLLAVSLLCLATSVSALAKDGPFWTTDFDGAQSQAQEEGKDLLLYFTGSDWCGPCIMMENTIFSQPAFRGSKVSDRLVPVKLDFPQAKPQTDALKRQNETLRDRYGVKGYPTLVLVDAQGRPYAQTGGMRTTPAGYAEHLLRLQRVRDLRDKAFAEAEGLKGPAKARALDRGLSAMDLEVVLNHYDSVIAQAIEADADNSAGVRDKWRHIEESQLVKRRLDELMLVGQQDGYESVVDGVDRLIEARQLGGELLQTALLYKSNALFLLDKKDAAETTLREALKVDPKTPTAEQIRGVLERYFRK